jgi:hypothetical protein
MFMLCSLNSLNMSTFLHDFWAGLVRYVQAIGEALADLGSKNVVSVADLRRWFCFGSCDAT